MKLRKSKSDKTFRIDYETQALRTVVLRPKSGPRDVTWFETRLTWEPALPEFVLAHSRGSALRGFLWGRDKNNIIINRAASANAICN